jgi:hypothetical protein
MGQGAAHSKDFYGFAIAEQESSSPVGWVPIPQFGLSFQPHPVHFKRCQRGHKERRGIGATDELVLDRHFRFAR